MKVVLLSFYDIGRQPFGLASPAAWLQSAGAHVSCQDLAVQRLDHELIKDAALVALYLPMHTATRMAVRVIQQIRVYNPNSHICCYGLYAPLNEQYLLDLGVDSVLGGEFEEGLVNLYVSLISSEKARPTSSTSLAKQRFVRPDRTGLPALSSYAYLDTGDGVRRLVGYTEASRGCKHMCLHCPVVPVYQGSFRVVQQDVVLDDIRQQVERGAEHITFGDPDFFNGPGHALRIVESMHREFPALTYDVTIKVEHLLAHHEHLETLSRTGCIFITSAVESFDDDVLEKLGKGHTHSDFEEVLDLCRQAQIHLQPTFVAFHPWLSINDYMAFLQTIARLNLIDSVASIQYAIRLLLPAGSHLLHLAKIRRIAEPFDREKLVYPWQHPDPQVDWLQQTVLSLVTKAESLKKNRYQLFCDIWHLTKTLLDDDMARCVAAPSAVPLTPYGSVPSLSENWYC
ncbi:MAG: CUAEP/CCAEP-tail radical SAM protein [Chloroflexota bacterium]